MLQATWWRKVIRIGFMTSVLAGLMLIFSAAQAHATWYDPSSWGQGSSRQIPDPRLGDGTAGGRGGARSSGRASSANNNQNEDEDVLVNMKPEIQQRVQAAGGQYIYGREAELREFEMSVPAYAGQTRGGAVTLEGEQGSGRDGLIEEIIRTNPGDDFYRLDIDKFARLNEDTAMRVLKEKIRFLEAQNVKFNGSKRVFLVVENLAALKTGARDNPIDILWEQVVRPAKLYFILKTDPATRYQEILDKNAKFKSLQGIVQNMEIRPPTYDAVVSYLIKNKGMLERDGVKVSLDAIEKAADIAIKNYKKTSFADAFRLLQEATALVIYERGQGATQLQLLNGQIRQLEARLQLLNEQAQIQPGDASVQARITDLNNQITDKKQTRDGLTAPAATRQDLAHATRERIDAEAVYERARQVDGKNAAELASLYAKVTTATERELMLREEVTKSESGVPSMTGREQVLEVASRKLKRSKASLDGDFEEGLRKINTVNDVVFGQEHVVEMIRRSLAIRQTNMGKLQRMPTPEEVELIKRGELQLDAKNVANILLGGNTGTGKTEVLRRVAELLGYEFFLLNMSEYKTKESISRLIGSDPGYANADEGGVLTNFVEQNPYTLVVFDEVEKGHWEIYDLCLQIMNDGELGNGKGKKINFRNVIVAMTTNAGREISIWDETKIKEFVKEKTGWTDEQLAAATNDDIQQLRTEAYRKFLIDPKAMAESNGAKPFRPELLSRLEHVAVTNPLAPKIATQIGQKNIKRFVDQLMAFHKVAARFTSDVILRYLESFDAAEGGRSFEKNLDRLFVGPTADLLIGDEHGPKLQPFQTLMIGLDPSGRVQLQPVDSEALAAAEAKAAKNPVETATLEPGQEEAKMSEARAATGALMDQTFDKGSFLKEEVFREFVR